MKKKLFTLMTLLLCLCSTAWATDPIIWNLEKNYSSSTEPECEGTVNNWSALSSSVYTYQKALSNAPLLNQAGDANFSLTDGLTFTCAAKKLQLGKGYLYFNEDASHGFSVPTTAGQYVNLVIGIGNTGATTSVTGGDITSISFPTTTKAYSINIRATGNKLTFTTNKKLYIYQIAVIDASDVVAPVIPSSEAGSYYKGLKLSLSTETDGATIKYVNATSVKIGADINTNYSGEFGLTSTGTRYISTIASKSVTGGTLYSDTKSYTYTITDQYPTPIATPGAGTYSSAQSVTFSNKGTSGSSEVDILPNGVIYYTLDGTTPSNSKTRYDGTPINITETKTLKAILYSDGTTNKGSVLEALYEIVEATDPVFSLSATSIPSNSTAQIKVGDNAGLDGVTLSNINYGTAGIVTVNASTGVVTPVAAGTTTITFDTDATVKYNASSNNELTITVTTPKCATPTITKGDFTFAENGYKVTITNNEDDGTLKVSTDGETYTTQTSPYVTYATTTTHYYAKSEKASYDDSDVADLNVANTYDTSKPYVAWVTTADDNDGIYTALSSVYNLIKCKYAASATVWNNGENDLKNADLIVLSESVGGSNAITTDMKNFVGQVPMINLKLFAYNSGRWNYGTAADNSSRVFTPSSNLYKVLNGVTFESNGTIELYGSNADKNINSVNFGSGSGCAEPTNNVKMGAIGGDNTKVAMHAIIDNNNLDKQFFGIGLCFGNKANFTDNAITIVKNAAAMLIAGEALNTEFSTISATVGANGYTTFACSYPLDLTDANRPEGLKAYKATRTGANLTFEKLNQTVPAGTGLLLLGETKGGSYNIPVVASSTAVEDNALIGVTSPVAKKSIENTTYYFVMKKAANADDQLKFAPITTAKAVTIPAGKAYIEVPNSELTSARELSYSFDEGNATGINGVEEIAPVTKTRKVVKNGRLVIETANGEFTIDGARVK